MEELRQRQQPESTAATATATAPAALSAALPPAGGRSVLEGAFALLDAVEQTGECGLTRLASESGLPKTTAYRLLEQLVALGAVERTGDRYRMGSRIFRLGRSWQPHPSLLAAARAEVRRLAGITGATVGVCVLREGRAMAVAGVNGEVEGLVRIRPSDTWSWTTAAGKILVAETGPAAPVGPLPSGWRREAGAIRERGVAYDREENIPGVCCVAVPLFARPGRAVAALCALASPSPRLPRLEQAVIRAGRVITANLR